MLYRFEFGGLQSLLAGCIDRMRASGMRHAIVCLAGYDAAAAAILPDGVELLDLDRARVGTWRAHIALYRHLRRLRPAVLHTYNIGALEYALTGFLAGVPRRVHAEHGRGMLERAGNHRNYNRLRRVLAPLVDTFVTVSDDMVAWLTGTVGIPARKVRLIPNGIDVVRFRPAHPDAATSTPVCTIGTIGRLDPIKAQADLVTAFAMLQQRYRGRVQLALVVVGEGSLGGALAQQARDAGIEDRVSLPGASRDVAAILHGFDVFVLPSVSEATPVTLLEAMASGIPVVATRVGGVPALIGADTRGTLVAPSDPAALADAIARQIDAPLAARQRANTARAFIATHYNLDATAARYATLYGATQPATARSRC